MRVPARPCALDRERLLQRPPAGEARRVPVGRAPKLLESERRCGATARGRSRGLRAARAPPPSPRARCAARRPRACPACRRLVEHRKRQPAAQPELVAGLFLLGVPVGESDRPRVAAAAGGRPVSSREDSWAESPYVATSGAPSGCGSTSMAAADSPSPAAASSTRRNEPSSESPRAGFGEAPQPVELAARAGRGRPLAPDLLPGLRGAHLGPGRGVAAAAKAGQEQDRGSQEECRERGHADGDPGRGLPGRQSAPPLTGRSSAGPLCDCRSFSGDF